MNCNVGSALQTAYREDWDHDKQFVYYPVHITPAYEAHADVKKVQSDVSAVTWSCVCWLRIQLDKHECDAFQRHAICTSLWIFI